ncbi:MAG: oxygenase MpaB family protein [Microthrixaceae bacterium]
MSDAGRSQRTRAEGAPLGPGSLLWRTAGDPRSLLTGTAAGIMQLMLPGLGAGVTDHSNFFDDPFDRIFRSVPYIWGTIFADDDAQGGRRGRKVRDFHPDIKGVDHKGRRYHALDPEVYWWAHATFTWEFFRARELYFPVPLSRAQKEQLYAETVTWYRRYGVSDRPVPATLADFEHRFSEICSNELEMTPAVKWVLDPASNPATGGPPVRLPGPLRFLESILGRTASDLMRVMVYGNMPDVVRRRFDFDWSNTDRATFVALCAAIRSAEPAIRMGAMGALFPEGTPHLDPRNPKRVVVAGPNPNQDRRRLQTSQS